MDENKNYYEVNTVVFNSSKYPNQTFQTTEYRFYNVYEIYIWFSRILSFAGLFVWMRIFKWLRIIWPSSGILVTTLFYSLKEIVSAFVIFLFLWMSFS
jgi:hypothetical protein